MSKKPYRILDVCHSRVFRMLACAAASAALAGPLAAQGVVPDAIVSSCASPLFIEPATLPYSSPAIDTRSLILVPTAVAPVFPCYAKLTLPSGGQVPPARIVWFTFTPAATDTYRIDTFGSTPSDYDTILGIYTGLCAALVSVSGVCGKNGFNPDDAPGSLQSSVTLTLTAGTPYTIAVGAIGAVDPFSGQVSPSPGGLLKLNVSQAPVSYAYTYLVPSLARTGGFVSDLSVTNLENADGQFLAQYLTHGNDGDQTMPAVQPVAPPQFVAANGTRLYPDVLGLIGYANDWGAMVVVSNRRLLVGARTWAAAPGGGTIGQFTPAVDISPGTASPEALSAGETGRFMSVREDAGMRTNLVFANATSVPCALQAEVRDGAGALLGATRTITVPPSTAIQKNRLKDTFAITADIRAASVVVRNVTAGCAVVGAAYVIDGNATPGTNDPYAVPLRK